MGALTRQYDWSQTSLGTPDNWPQSLRTTLSIILNSKFPMFLFWGQELLCFYNDAYSPSLGNDGKHPYALGQPGVDVWPEIWADIKPLIDQVVAGGEASWSEDQFLPIYRNGQLEDVYWTFSYSPVSDESGKPAGVFVTCTETTEKVKNIKQLEESKDQLEFAIEATELGTWDLNPLTNKFTANARLKEWFGLLPDDEVELPLAISVVAERDRQRVTEAIGQALQYSSGGQYDIEYTIINSQTQQERIVRAKGKAWFTDTQIAYRFNGTLQDITRERKAQQLADLAIKSSGIGLFRVDLVSEQIDYTPAYAAIITGDPTKKELSRQGFVKYVHPDDRLLREIATQAGLESGNLYYQTRVVWEDGSVHHISVMGGFVRDEQDQPITFSGTVRDITESENQRQALHEAEERFAQAQRQSDALFRNVTNSSPTGLWLSDEEGGLTYLNKTLVEWTGMPYEELLGTGWTRAIIDEDRQRSTDAFRTAVAAHAHYDVQFRIRKGDGRIVWCQAAGDPYCRDDGTYAGYAGFCLNIEELVAGREALQQSEAKFRSLIEEAPVATCLFVGRDMNIEVANEMMIGYWGKDRSVLGRPLELAVPELKGQIFLDLLDEAFKTGETYESKATRAELEVNGTLGTYYFDFTYKPLRNAAGEVYGIMDMAVDVTEQVLAKQKLEEAEASLRGAIEMAELATWVMDPATGLVTYSERLRTWFGFQNDETVHNTRYNPIIKQDQDRVREAVDYALTPQSGGVLNIEYTTVAYRTGRKRILRTQGKTLFDEAGKPIRLTGTAQDITEQRQIQLALEQQVQERTEELEAVNEELATTNEELAAANEELTESNQLLSRSNDNLEKFAYIASHDLQEPLRKIQQFGDLLQTRYAAPSGDELVYLERMQSAASRMSMLIRDLLSFSRISTRKEAIELVSLNRVIQASMLDLDLRIQETGAVIEVAPLPAVPGDASQLNLLFQNLLSNALKFRRIDPSGVSISPHIQVVAHRVAPADLPQVVKPTRTASLYYRIDVSDNGIGFDEKYVDRIFQVFQRLHSKNQYAGTGIGLAICEKVAANHGGAITASSKPGQGATFSVYLPA